MFQNLLLKNINVVKISKYERNTKIWTVSQMSTRQKYLCSKFLYLAISLQKYLLRSWSLFPWYIFTCERVSNLLIYQNIISKYFFILWFLLLIKLNFFTFIGLVKLNFTVLNMNMNINHQYE